MKYKEIRALFSRRFNLPKEHSLKKTLRTFTMAEKAVFYVLVGIFIFSGLYMLWKVNESYLVEVPASGGSLTEGVVGNPRFINPVLAISEADKNLTTLIYSGLVRITPDGSIENDVAESLDISDDGKTYTVSIHPEAKFHDGEPITAEDILFTVQKMVDPLIKSPKRGNWDGVSIEKIDDLTLSFTLKQAYTPFIYNLATGILPKHIWKNVSDDEFSFSQFNTLPIGSGPFKVERVERNSGGIPNFYNLIPFENVSKAPYINLVFRFYPNEDMLIEAYKKNEVESLSGVSPEKLLTLKNNGSEVLSSPLPRIFAVFFNQSQSKVLLNKEVRRALDIASPKQEIVDNILHGYGTVIDGPLPAGIYPEAKVEEKTEEERISEAKEILLNAGWKPNPETGVLEKKSGSSNISLSFSLSTGDAPELRQVAEELVAAWQKLGADVRIQVSETGDLNQNVIRPRNFDALLFGEVVSRDTDLYPFWHSSQRQDPGLNIALYANGRADKLLEEARQLRDTEKVEASYMAFRDEIKNDVPAIFLYTPSFLYVVPEKVSAIKLGALTLPQDRFLSVRDWYIETDKIWKIFTN